MPKFVVRDCKEKEETTEFYLEKNGCGGIALKAFMPHLGTSTFVLDISADGKISRRHCVKVETGLKLGVGGRVVVEE